MQAKKKVKEIKKKSFDLAKYPAPNQDHNNEESVTQGGLNPNIVNNIIGNSQVNQNAFNGIMNLLNANKNVNPAMMAQMMAMAVSLVNQNNQTPVVGQMGPITNTNISPINNNSETRMLNRKRGSSGQPTLKTFKNKGKIHFRNKLSQSNRVKFPSTSNNTLTNLNTENS